MNARRDGALVVELRAARIPRIGAVAHHHWLVVRAPGRAERWEVWQRPAAGGESWGHLHRNLLPAEQGVGGGGSWLAAAFEGDAAAALADRLARAATEYPWRHAYRYWPGPNSNTFAQWVLGTRHRLPWRGIGRSYSASANFASVRW